MLKITEHQLDHLKKAKLLDFCHALTRYLEAHYAHEFSLLGDEPAQQHWIQSVITDAQGYAMEREADLYTYLRAAITFDEDFHEQPWANSILQLTVMPSTKAGLLGDAMADELDKRAAQSAREKNELLKQKVINYAKEKAGYVYSFNTFYGLGLNDIDEAEHWVMDVANMAITYDFTDDFLLDSVLEVALYFGKDVHTKGWAQAILTSEGTASDKIAQLLSYLSVNFGNKDAKH